MPPSWGAGALLHPGRTLANKEPHRLHENREFQGAGVRLKGWWFKVEGVKRGTVVYLHGSGDNRGSSCSVADHFVPMGYEVIAYDSRAHGESDGQACTYGYFEKQDLKRVLDQLEAKAPIIVLGASLGAAVALQAAAEDARISGVIAVATFSDLRTVAFERAPFFASRGNIEGALRIAEKQGGFRVDEVSPTLAAQKIDVPVFLIHGMNDKETPPAHSRRVYEVLRKSKTLFLVPNAGHNDAINGASWKKIDAWMMKTAGLGGLG